MRIHPARLRLGVGFHCAWIATALVLLLSAPSSAAAQETVPPGIELGLLATIRALKDSQMVRVASLGSGHSEGRVLQRSDSLLLLEANGNTVRVPSAAIDTLWVRGNSLGSGLAWGAGIGLVAGLASGLILNEAFCNDSDSGCADDDAQVILAFGLLGVGAGTLTGAIIGALTPKWNRRWP
jgi:hypothetical protein